MLYGGISIHKIVMELTERVLRLTPSFLGAKICDILAAGEGYTLDVLEGQKLYCEKGDINVPGINGGGKSTEPHIGELLKMAPYAVRYRFPAFNALLDYMGKPYIRVIENKKTNL